LLLIYTNSIAIFDQVSSLILKDRTCTSYATTLGEIEPVAEYIISNSNGQRLVYFGGDKALHVVTYILRKRDINSIEINKNPNSSENNGLAYIASCKSNLKNTYPYKKIGSIFVFRLNN